jgi:2',3'-cyclic-nucleotide 2'-phosphodiesterase (5'-nucleotidase family)
MLFKIRIKISRLKILLVAICFLFCLSSLLAEEILHIFHTSDIHDHPRYLSRIAQIVNEYRAKGENVLFIDTGDRVGKGKKSLEATKGLAISHIMSKMGYDAMILGNHDFRYGTQRLNELIRRFNQPILAANSEWTRGSIPTQVEVSKDFKFPGLNVSIIGTSATKTNKFVDTDIRVNDVINSCSMLIKKAKIKSDLVVFLTHIGTEDEEIIPHIPDVDILLGGHDNRCFFEENFFSKEKTLLQHSGRRGKHLGHIKVKYENHKVNGYAVKLIKMNLMMPEDPEISKLVSRYWSDKPRSFKKKNHKK